MTDEELRARALKWFDIIYKETQQIIIHQHVFWEVQDIIKANEKLPESLSLPSVRVGRRYLVRWTTLEQWERKIENTNPGFNLPGQDS